MQSRHRRDRRNGCGRQRDARVVHVLAALERGGPREVGAVVIRDHVVVVADLVLVGPTHEAVPDRADLLIDRPPEHAVATDQEHTGKN